MPEIIVLQESTGKDLKPRIHDKIVDLESFVETFLYFFEQGSNAEYVSIDKDLFFLFIDRLYQRPSSSTRDEGSGPI